MSPNPKNHNQFQEARRLLFFIIPNDFREELYQRSAKILIYKNRMALYIESKIQGDLLIKKNYDF